MTNKKAIVHCIVLNEALNKRRIYLDAIATGLEVHGVKTLLSHFPELLKQLFVSSTKLEPNDVMKLLLSSSITMDESQTRVWGYLQEFIEGCSEAGTDMLHWHDLSTCVRSFFG